MPKSSDCLRLLAHPAVRAKRMIEGAFPFAFHSATLTIAASGETQREGMSALRTGWAEDDAKSQLPFRRVLTWKAEYSLAGLGIDSSFVA